MQQSEQTAPSPPQPGAVGVSLVIPMHDEEANVRPLVEEIGTVLSNDLDYEIVLIDDASQDGTIAAIQALMRDPELPVARRVRLLKHQSRTGKSGAIFTGAGAARGTLLVLMDGDLQNDPRDIAAMLQTFEARGGLGKVGLVQGQRRRRRDTWLKRLSSRTANHVRRALLRDKTVDTGCGLKLLPREVMVSLPRFDGMHRFTPALVGRTGLSIELVPVNDRPRVAGVSKYGLWNRLWVGIGDLLTVWWLIRRFRRPGEIVELRAAPPAGRQEE